MELIYRAAHRPSGNGLIERNHRTVKRIAARVGSSVQEAVFLYNLLPRTGTDVSTAPSYQLFKRQWSLNRWVGRATQGGRPGNSSYKAGDVVFVKPAGANCTSKWPKGRVTRVTERGAIEVNGVHRHEADIRPVVVLGDSLLEEGAYDTDSGSEEEEAPGGGHGEPVRRSERVAARPWRYDGSEYDVRL